MRSKFAIGCSALLWGGWACRSLAAASAAPLPQAKVEQAVIASVPVWDGQRAKILKYLDLTKPFATMSPWTLVVAQDAGPPAEPNLEGHGPIAICFVKALAPHCAEKYPLHGRWVRWSAKYGSDLLWYVTAYDLDTADVVYAGEGKIRLLLLRTSSAPSGDGNRNVRTALFDYDRQKDRFRQVFDHLSGGSNNNQAAWFVESGPLQGDVIVDYPTDHAPYTYWIEVYAPGKSGQYTRIVRYRGHTGYGDGNPLPVADSEMPEILERLGLWKPGGALPVPAQMPADCGRLVMRGGEEWCQNLCNRYAGTDCGHSVRLKGGEMRGR